MDLELTEEQRMLADSARAFVSEELLPHENEVEKQGEVPPDLGQQITRKAIEMGFYAANLPESVGGGGLDYTSLAVIEREFGKVSHALNGFAWGPTELLMACEGNQIERYLDPCVRAEKTECFAITEPGAGPDILSMATRAEKVGNDWIINGSKHFVSSHPAGFRHCFCSDWHRSNRSRSAKRVTAFLVDRGHRVLICTRTPLCQPACLSELCTVFQ
ncbi:MAG: hypothetical protein CM1200mP18_11950 [Gammaproteobacteria bacterium]|nr:MAG: hypothetical protein CM1200mP18_11950 [Gammaproteobacteria bacterium]